MEQLKMHYIPIINQKANNAIRLRHLKYVNAVHHNVADAKVKRIANRNNLSFKKEHFSLKSTRRLEVSQSQLTHTVELNHLFRLAKGLKKISFLQTYDPLFVTPKSNKTSSLLLNRAMNLKALVFSYEIQNPHCADYERFYETLLTLNGSIPSKMDSKVVSESICSQLQDLKVVLPSDVTFIVDFRVSNEILDNPPINRLNHNNDNYVWNLAASYFTLSNVENSYAYKFESFLNIRKVFLSCEASNDSFEYFKQFLNKLPHIDSLHFQLKKAVSSQMISFKDLVSTVNSDMNLKKLIIDCGEIDLDPVELLDVQFPNELTLLHLDLKNTKIKNFSNIDAIEQLPEKFRSLNNLKNLKLTFPTTYFINQMIHQIPENLQALESLHLDFPEGNEVRGDEDLYLNSLLEVISTMTNLKEFYLKSNRLNYTYSAYLAPLTMPSGLKTLQWIDDSLQYNTRPQKEVDTKQWIECKKFEDLNIIMSLLSEDLEHLEIPFVFDGLESEFVALRFLEAFSKLQKLKNLNISFGFKTLDQSNIETINNFISKIENASTGMKDFHLKTNVYYRKVKGDVNVHELDFSNKNAFKSKRRSSLQYVVDRFS